MYLAEEISKQKEQLGFSWVYNQKKFVSINQWMGKKLKTNIPLQFNSTTYHKGKNYWNVQQQMWIIKAFM